MYVLCAAEWSFRAISYCFVHRRTSRFGSRFGSKRDFKNMAELIERKLQEKAPKSVDFGAFSCVLQSKSSTIFLKSRCDPNRDPNRDVRRCTKQYEIARKGHSTAHKTYIKSVFFHKKRARCRFDSAPAMPCVTPLPGRSFDRWCPQPARACWAWSGRRC